MNFLNLKKLSILILLYILGSNSYAGWLDLNMPKGVTDISNEVLNSSLEYIIKNKERLDEHIENKQHFMSYCKLKIKNQLIDYYRKEKNIESIYRENDEGDLEMKEELFYDNTKKSFKSHDNIMDLNKALSKLSSKCRELLLLWGEGYSEKELSVKYGKTASTIGVQTHRCLKKLIPF